MGECLDDMSNSCVYAHVCIDVDRAAYMQSQAEAEQTNVSMHRRVHASQDGCSCIAMTSAFCGSRSFD